MSPDALFKLTYGLYLLSVREGGRDNGCVINTAVQVSSDPLRLSISVAKSNLTCEMLAASGRFALSTFTEDTPFSLFQRFGLQSGRTADKFAGFDRAARSDDGLLYLTEANMYLTAQVTDQLDLGSHVLFLAEPIHSAVLSDRPTCSYDYYRTHIKPRPQTAPKKGWVCTVCGFVYEGDEVPDDYICPLCKHGKEAFVPVT